MQAPEGGNRQQKPRYQAAQRRAQLIEAARRVFIATGPDGGSMRQIAAAAGVNVSLLYRHFHSQRELYRVAVIDPLEDRLRERVELSEDLIAKSESPAERMVTLHSTILSTMVDVAPWLGIALFADQSEGRAFYRDRIEPLLERWVTTTLFSPDQWADSGIEISTLAVAFFGIHLFIALDAYFRDEMVDVAATARSISSFLDTGVAD